MLNADYGVAVVVVYGKGQKIVAGRKIAQPRTKEIIMCDEMKRFTAKLSKCPTLHYRE